MKFCHKSNLLICQILSKALTYCKRFNVRRTPINPKEIVEKYEKSNMQILAVKKQKSSTVTRQMASVAVLEDAFVTFH